MKKTALALAILLGGFAVGTASAAPMAPAGIQAERDVTQARMSHHGRRMMHRHHHRGVRHRM
ncbi:hypothetical protein MPAR168_22405 [Methylorubrum populi]|uniref:Uncharacterized protein n=1 Tax=Methylobacterium radiotolerans TaxID=31998 RepID=A0ABU7TH06_9HYPH